ncbi:MAG: CYTH domain-containing protein [Lentisphaeria bacterium]|nr:CYTH domain-containing protein [Lentisphaeria bacterium]
MAKEIERKFLLASNLWRELTVSSTYMKQGYLAATGATIRVRLQENQAFLTIKGKPAGLVRNEYEYPIPEADAREILSALSVYPPVEKIRHIIPAEDGLCWEVDEYLGENAPLFTAEIELPEPDTEFDIPEWIGTEITGDGRYTNRALSRFPYSLWQEEE